MHNKLCVSVWTSDVNSLKNMIEECFSAKADFIEVRFDFFKWDIIDDVLEQVLDYKEKSIYTCRSPNEGGKFTATEKERITTIQRLASFRPMLLDVEYITILNNQGLLDMFEALNCETLVSWHDFEKTPSLEELRDQMLKMKNYSANVKIVTTAKDLADSISIMKLYDHARASDVNLIAFCMGEAGILSRVLCTYAGAKFTYSSLSDGLAPGQLSLKQMHSIYERLERDKPELNDYSAWKDKHDLKEILPLISQFTASDKNVS